MTNRLNQRIISEHQLLPKLSTSGGANESVAAKVKHKKDIILSKYTSALNKCRDARLKKEFFAILFAVYHSSNQLKSMSKAEAEKRFARLESYKPYIAGCLKRLGFQVDTAVNMVDCINELCFFVAHQSDRTKWFRFADSLPGHLQTLWSSQHGNEVQKDYTFELSRKAIEDNIKPAELTAEVKLLKDQMKEGGVNERKYIGSKLVVIEKEEIFATKEAATQRFLNGFARKDDQAENLNYAVLCKVSNQNSYLYTPVSFENNELKFVLTSYSDAGSDWPSEYMQAKLERNTSINGNNIGAVEGKGKWSEATKVVPHHQRSSAINQVNDSGPSMDVDSVNACCSLIECILGLFSICG